MVTNQKIWIDINRIPNISYPLVLKCLTNINKLTISDIDKCIQTVQWINTNNYNLNKYELKYYSQSIHKLIIKCNNIKQLKQIHKLITEINHNDIYIYTALISKYSKCNDINMSEYIFKSINENKKDIPCINAMITAFLHNESNRKALDLYNEYAAIIENNDVFNMLGIKACIKCKQYTIGKQIINKYNINISNNKQLNHILIEFYGEINEISNAKNIFYSINDNNKDFVTLGTMLKILIRSNYNQDALNMYNKYPQLINDTCSSLALKACININAFDKGQIIAECIYKNFNNHSIQLINGLIDFYGHFEYITIAKNIFDEIKDNKKDIISLNSIMNICNRNGYYNDSLVFYDKYYVFLSDKVVSNRYGLNDLAIVLALNACLNTNNYNKGKYIHLNISKKLLNIVHVNNALIAFYGYFGDIYNGEMIFNSIGNNKDTITINSMIKLYINNGYYNKALNIYQTYNTLTDVISHFSAIKACIELNEYEIGINIHANIGNNIYDLLLKTTLIDFYGHFGNINMCEILFDSILENEHNNVSINSMMKVYLNNNNYLNVLKLYDKYYLLTDNISHLNAIKACIYSENFQKGVDIYNKIILNKNKSIELQNTLIEFYGHFGDIKTAEMIFNEIINVDIININTLMEVYCKNELNTKCIDLFNNIGEYGLKYDIISCEIVLKACTQSTSFHFATKIHKDLQLNYPEYLNDTSIIINLINLYGKCGMINEVENIFYVNDNNKENIDICHACIKAYGRNGNFSKTQMIYNKYLRNRANRKTYILLMNAYTHCGYINETENIWLKDIMDEDIKYDCYVITCLVDCFSKNGYLNKAMKLIEDYEFRKNNNVHSPMWISLINGCKMFNDKQMARKIYDIVINKQEIDDKHKASAAILLSNTCA